MALRLRIALTTALALSGGCGSDKRAEPSRGDAAAAKRESAPPEIEANAVALGATAPDLELVGTSGRYRLGDELGRRERVLLVLYRGDW